ncbi:MAG: DUF3800 domain-containing protein [Actinomycetota bacterium]|nr:DUF3800 domain-containing protein [Actinomycetota bacterium]
MTELDYMIIACAIQKSKHLKKYGLAALDPYMLALHILVERLIFEKKARGDKSLAHIVAESRGEILNSTLHLAWMKIRTSGTEYLSSSEVRRNITEHLDFRDKKDDIAGLQLADLIASPIGRKVLEKPINPHLSYQIPKGYLLALLNNASEQAYR